MRRTVQGMPSVMRDTELTTGFTKASPVVIPDKMPMTTLNRDLNARAKPVRTTKVAETLLSMENIVEFRGEISFLAPWRTDNHYTRITQLWEGHFEVAEQPQWPPGQRNAK